MRERRSEYDVTDTVDLYDVDDVRDAIIDIIGNTNSRFNKSILKRAFDDCHRLFIGEYPGYLPCDTLYHDQQHTFDMTLALARLIDGHDRLADKSRRIGADRTVLGIITALFHDSGYVRRHADHKHHNGAEYTTVHVSRSAEFLKRYLHKIGMGEYAQTSAHMVHYTGYEVAPGNIQLPDATTHLVGHMLGTADLLAQMSDRCYLEKCRDRLYPEFVLGGVAVQVDDKGNEHVVYASGEDLLRKTPAFYEHEVENRLNRLFNKVYDYEISHFDGERKYIHALGQNQSYLKKVLELNNFGLLRRGPPENYGTRNFPGLDAFSDLRPAQRRQVG
jgi:hypothetical protein